MAYLRLILPCLLTLIAAVGFTLACGFDSSSAATPVPADTPIPAATPRPAGAPTPADTPIPTAMPKPAATPMPTPVALGDCRDGMRLRPGEGCRYIGGGSLRANVVLSAQRDGVICREGGPVEQFGIVIDSMRLCADGFERDEAFQSDIAVRKNPGGSWTFYESGLSASGAVAPRSVVPPVSLSEFEGASESEQKSMFDGGRIQRCGAGLALPPDSFCVDEGATSLADASFMVAHLPDGPGLVVQGGSMMQAGGNIQLGWIAYEKRGADRVITHLDPPTSALAISPSRPAATPRPTSTPRPAATPTPTSTPRTTETPTATPSPTATPIPTPRVPTGVQYRHVGATIVVSWNAVSDADYYNIYHDSFHGSNCSLSISGTPIFCNLLAENVSGASYTHTSPAGGDNYYWIVACNSGGCTDIDSEHPARSAGATPGATSTPRPTYTPRLTRTPRSTPTPETPYRPIVRVIDRTSDSLTIELIHPAATYIELRRRDDDSSSLWTDLGNHSSGYKYNDTNLHSNSTYYYSARACNSNGCSEYSGDSGGITEAVGQVQQPSIPVGFAVAKVTVFLETDDTESTWHTVEGATYYQVYQGTSLDAEVSAPQTVYVDNSPNTFFGTFQSTTYKVRACNKAGCSPFSETVLVH